MLVGLALLWPGAAGAIPDTGSHETVDLTTSTAQPGVSAALGYSGRYHAANDPNGDPPALRRLVIELPPGTRVDTSVLPQCTASDSEIMLVGESACPARARIGEGQATVKQVGTGTVSTYDTVIYNADNDMLELVESGGRVLAVVHTYVHGTTLDGPVPTCINGGDPPSGCPVDELILLANHLQIHAFSAGGRNYGTTPPTCPASGRWLAPVTFYYADGSVDQVTPQAPCTPTPATPTRHSPTPPRHASRNRKKAAARLPLRRRHIRHHAPRHSR
jgi:hypothetical protein